MAVAVPSRLNCLRMRHRLIGAVLAVGAVAFAAAPVDGVAFASPSPNAGCAGVVSAAVATGGVPKIADRVAFERIIQRNAAREGVPPGDIVSRHAQMHGDLAFCLG
jgi:hypothetical protein